MDIKYNLVMNMVLNWVLVECVLMTSVLSTFIFQVVIVHLLESGLFLDYVLTIIPMTVALVLHRGLLLAFSKE